MADEMSPEKRQAIDRTLKWIEKVSDEFCATGDQEVIANAVDSLADEQLPGLAFILLVNHCENVKLSQDREADTGGPTLH